MGTRKGKPNPKVSIKCDSCKKMFLRNKYRVTAFNVCSKCNIQTQSKWMNVTLFPKKSNKK